MQRKIIALFLSSTIMFTSMCPAPVVITAEEFKTLEIQIIKQPVIEQPVIGQPVIEQPVIEQQIIIEQQVIEQQVIIPPIMTYDDVVVEPVTIEHAVEEIIIQTIPLDYTSQMTEEVFPISQEEIELIALVTMAEAEGECEEGRRLVIDTILNRVDSEHFPDNIYDVVHQRAAFSAMWNGRAKRCIITEEICNLVKDELKHRTNYDVMFFTAGGYGNYGDHLFQVGGHYFSSDY